MLLTSPLSSPLKNPVRDAFSPGGSSQSLTAQAQALFAGGYTGWLHDFGSSTGQLWADTAATIPAAVNDSVKAITDLSSSATKVTQATTGNCAILRGTPTGANLITEPSFFATTGWTNGAGWTYTSPTATAVTASGALSHTFVPIVGHTYQIRYRVEVASAGSVAATLGGATGQTATAVGVICEWLTATTTAPFVLTASGFTGQIGAFEVFDVSVGNVKAPYFLTFDGSDDYYSASTPINAYPATLAASATHYGSGVHGACALHAADNSVKFLNVSGNAYDWEASGITAAYSYGAFRNARQVVRGEFKSATTQYDADLIASAPVANTNAWVSKTSFFVGKGRNAAFYMRGKYYGGFGISRALSTPEKAVVDAMLKADLSVQAWGDSMTAGQGIQLQWITRLGDRLERVIENKGAGGQTSDQITTRFNADASKRSWINTFWMGTNDNAALPTWQSTIETNISNCAAALTGAKRCLVLGVTKSDGGSVSLPQLASLDAALLATYGDRFVDVRAYLQSKGDGSVNDNADIANGLVPRSLRADIIHLNAKGYQHVTDLLAARIVALGWV